MKKYIWAKDTPWAEKGDSTGYLTKPEAERLLTEGWVEETGRWKPKRADEFFYIDTNMDVKKGYWYECYFNEGNYKIGNVFPSFEEAIAAAEKVKALLLSLHE